MRDDLLRPLLARLARFQVSHDPRVILDPQALTQASELFSSINDAALQQGPSDASRALEVVTAIAMLHWLRYKLLPEGEDQDDLQAAAQLFTTVYPVRPEAVPEPLRELYEAQTNVPTDRFDGDPVAGNSAATATPAGYRAPAADLISLGDALTRQFELTGQAGALDEGISAFREAVAITPADHPLRAAYLAILGGTLTRRVEQTGQPEGLDEAIGLLGDAVAITPADHPNRAAFLSSLGGALTSRFDHSGQVAALDEAISAYRDAVAASRTEDPDRAMYLMNLGGVLARRFNRTGQVAALDEAIGVLTDAVAVTPADHPGRAMSLSSLGNALTSRFERTGQVAALDKAINAHRKAVDAAPTDHPSRAMYLSNLGNALTNRFDRTGQVAALDEAIGVLTDAVAVAPPDHPNRAGYLSNLGNALTSRFEHTGQTGALDEAISAYREAVQATPADHPSQAMFLSYLGVALTRRFEHTGDSGARHAAAAAFRTATGIAGAPAIVRARSARAWGELAAASDDTRGAVDGFAAAVGLLDLVAWRGADRADQERMLTQFARLATDAAACAIQAGDPELALELLEQGRGVLLAQTLDARTGYSVLREAAPDLADRLARIHEALERPLAQAAVDLDPDRAAMVLQRQADQRNELANQRDALVDEIRMLPGFTDFLRPPRFTTLRAAAANGAVVIVNISRYRCDALTLTSAGVHLTPLDQLTSQEVFQRVVTFVAALYAIRQPEAAIGEQRDRQLLEARRTMIKILAWTWDMICAPVLTDLGLTGPPQSGQGWPRIWWCPTGLLTFLPLHAAGRHATRNAGCPATVLDRAVSSYTPTLRVLLHTRERTILAGTSDTRPLVVAMPTTPGQPDLPAAGQEAAAFASRFPASEQLIGPTATRDAVLDGLTRCPWAHFACHGAQDISAPSEGHLRLYDGPLTTRELTGRNLDHAELAFLSACETFRGGVDLADEAITVAAAMQLAGYRHVIGSLWSIADSLAPEIASSVYADLTRLHPPRIDTEMTAVALHSAVHALRDQLPHAPTLWAQYIHLGP